MASLLLAWGRGYVGIHLPSNYGAPALYIPSWYKCPRAASTNLSISITTIRPSGPPDKASAQPEQNKTTPGGLAGIEVVSIRAPGPVWCRGGWGWMHSPSWRAPWYNQTPAMTYGGVCSRSTSPRTATAFLVTMSSLTRSHCQYDAVCNVWNKITVPEQQLLSCFCPACM